MRRKYFIVCAMAVLSAALFYNEPSLVFGDDVVYQQPELQGTDVVCPQTELQGTWDIAISVSDEGCPGDYSMKCRKVQIDADGAIQSTGAVIKNMCGSATVIGGQLTMSSECIIDGWIETTAGTFYGERGGFLGKGKIVIDRVADRKIWSPLRLTRTAQDLK